MRPVFAHAYALAQTYKWRFREFKGKELSEQLELSVLTNVSDNRIYNLY